MTKAELVAAIAKEAGIVKFKAEKALDGFISAVSGALGTGNKLLW
jgi:nucleoid DNA-binding protein